MTQIREETIVRCPPQRAKGYLVDYLRSQKSEDGGARLKLVATIGPREGPHVSVSREAVASLEAASTEPLEYKVRIRWTPATGGPLPDFEGAFHIQWDEEYGNCLLIVTGTYEPPLGAIGKVFDAAAGRKLAQSTLSALLDTLREAIESAYGKDVRKPES
jgi:hypothetical protein